MSDKTGRLFFDISALLNYVRSADNYTGIQRVAVTIISEMSELVDPETLYVTWFDRKKKTHFCTPFSQIGRDAFASPTSIRQRFRLGRARRSSIPVLRHYRKRPVAYFLRRSWLDLQSVLGNDRRFRKYDMTAQMWRDARRKPTCTNAHELEKRPLKDVQNQSDHLILLDSAWMPEHMTAFTAAKQRGMTVHSMVYDLIPILMPDVCSGSTPSSFFEWLLKSTEYTDQYIAISTSTGRDLKTFLECHSVVCPVNDVALAQAPMPPIHKDNAFQTGAGPLEALVADTVYPKLKAALTQDDWFRRVLASPFVLCVGTIEARKNVWRIALAWKALLDQGTYALPKLVFAGKWGWLHDDFKDFLQGTSNLYGYIQVIEGPSDTELEQLYGACLFTVMPSLYEGWGLPVGEALAYGKTAVVADNSSLPEVGGDLVEYCDAHSVESIAGALKLVLDPDHRALLEAKIATTDLRGWTDVAKDLLITIDAQGKVPET